MSGDHNQYQKPDHAAQRQPEPIGWVYEDDEGRMMFTQMPHPDPLWEPVYKAAPKRKWVGLTDEEILGEYRQSYGDDGDLTDVYFARAIEAKLKEKNG
jgi:hypothetical protein